MSQINVNTIKDKSGLGAPSFPNGVNATGVITATSFAGDGSSLTGIDSSSLSFGGSTKVQANTSGAVITGVTTSTSFVGNLTGNVTGNINGDLTGTLQTAAQPNITSLGTLSSLNVTGGVSIGGTLTYEDVTNVDSVGLITARNGIKVTDGDIEVGSGLKHLHSDSTTTYTVEVITKTAAHRYYGQGSSLGYIFDGAQSPFLTLTPGRTYKFDQAHGSNNTHQIKFYRDAAKSANSLYEQGVTYNGTAGQAGAYTQIVVSDTTPKVLHYQCVNHGYMGNALSANTGDAVPLETTDGGVNITGVCTATDFSGAAAGAADFPNGINVANTKTVAFPGDGTSGAYIKHQSGHFEIDNNTGNTYFATTGILYLRTNGATTALTLDASQNATFAGTVSDPKGDLRSIPLNTQSGAGNYNLVVGDAGKCVLASGNVTFNTGIFSAGDAVTIINNTNGNITITQGSGAAMYDTSDGTTGNRTLATRGMASIYFTHNTTGYISGSGLT
tara:strand:+ start:2337 stop:3836 length:1500 start_codon:yes stop_codon:yes gene_type:complete